MKNIYQIKDVKANVYHTPFFENHVEIAKRSLGITVNNPDSTIFHYPQDFELLLRGQYDDETGAITIHDEYTTVCNCYSLKTQEIPNAPKNNA